MSLGFSFHITQYFQAAVRLRSSQERVENRAQQLHVCSQAASHDMGGEDAASWYTCVWQMWFWHQLFGNTFFKITAVESLEQSWTVVRSPSSKDERWGCGLVQWSQCRGHVAQVAHSSASAGPVQGFRAAIRQPCLSHVNCALQKGCLKTVTEQIR